MRKTLSRFLSRYVWVYELLGHAFLITYIIFSIINIKISIYFYIALLFADIMGFLLFKDYTMDQIKGFNYIRIRILAWIVMVILSFLRNLEHVINIEIPISLFIIVAMLGVMFGIVGLFTNNQEKQEKIMEISAKRVLGEPTNDELDEKSCDVIICKSKETNEDVIIKEKDRMLHMVVYGPTGSGKSSMILLPMIYQDIDKPCGMILFEPKGDLAEKFYAIGLAKKKTVIYFCPTDYDCPYFNPLDGEETRVTEQLVTTFLMLSPDSKTFFKDMTENLLRHAVRVLKRLETAYLEPETGISSHPATLIRLNELIQNKVKGRQIVNEFMEIPTITEDEAAQNKESSDWFINDYFADRSEAWKHTSGVRNQVSKLIQNKYLRRVLNPENGKSDINFDEILEKGLRLSISTAEDELEELGGFLGYFLILSLQSAVFRRPGFEWTRKPCFVYIDECQTYLNSGYENMLTKGRSFRCGSILATQSRQHIVDKSGRAISGVIDTNCRNVVLFPGIASADAKYYQEEFGEKEVIEERFSETHQKFELGHGFRDMNYPTEAKSYAKVKKPNYSATDLIYKGFQEVTFKRIKEGTVQFAMDGITSFLSKDIDDQLNDLVIRYKQNQMDKINERDYEQTMLRFKVNKEFQERKGYRKAASGKKEGETKESDPWGESNPEPSKIKDAILYDEFFGESHEMDDEIVNEPNIKNDSEFDLTLDPEDLEILGLE